MRMQFVPELAQLSPVQAHEANVPKGAVVDKISDPPWVLSNLGLTGQLDDTLPGFA